MFATFPQPEVRICISKTQVKLGQHVACGRKTLIHMYVLHCLKDDVLPEMLSPLKISLPKANGYYHPLAISFPSY